jgi:Tol biopolymer transport system component
MTPMLRKITLISVLLVTWLVACQVKGYKIPNPPSSSKNASELQVTGNRSVFVEETLLYSLSPDGKWYFGQGLETICIFEAATLTEKVCSNWATTLDLNSIAWAPDSLRVAFTENLNALVESDIWVFDISSGVLSDITNDGLEGDLSTTLQRAESESTEINLDSLPVWSPDGKTLAFIRSTYGNTKQTFLCLIPATGGQATKLLIVDDQHSLAVWRGMRWTPDGKKILFTITILEDETGKNGIWVVDKNGENYTQLVKDKEGWGYVSLYDVSAKGDVALIGYPRAIAFSAKNPNLCFYELMDIKTGKLTPLIESPSGDQVEFYSPTQVTFSPDGSKILYHFNLKAGEQSTPQLVVQDVKGTSKEVLGNPTMYSGEDVGSSIFWAANDTIFLMTGPGVGTLYQLGSK